MIFHEDGLIVLELDSAAEIAELVSRNPGAIQDVTVAASLDVPVQYAISIPSSLDDCQTLFNVVGNRGLNDIDQHIAWLSAHEIKMGSLETIAVLPDLPEDVWPPTSEPWPSLPVPPALAPENVSVEYVAKKLGIRASDILKIAAFSGGVVDVVLHSQDLRQVLCAFYDRIAKGVVGYTSDGSSAFTIMDLGRIGRLPYANPALSMPASARLEDKPFGGGLAVVAPAISDEKSKIAEIFGIDVREIRQRRSGDGSVLLELSSVELKQQLYKRFGPDMLGCRTMDNPWLSIHNMDKLMAQSASKASSGIDGAGVLIEFCAKSGVDAAMVLTHQFDHATKKLTIQFITPDIKQAVRGFNPSKITCRHDDNPWAQIHMDKIKELKLMPTLDQSRANAMAKTIRHHYPGATEIMPYVAKTVPVPKASGFAALFQAAKQQLILAVCFRFEGGLFTRTDADLAALKQSEVTASYQQRSGGA
ncbi:MAG: hypothetical protein COB66_02645 [Coxiella sp. (in: Bacteria)]|nr:MAG: hypothetical protein COB66_02645 [Coxiella sp. (in: g-proteobacteria)]